MALVKNGAEFSDSLTSNLLRIIQHMRPKKQKHSLNSTKAINDPTPNQLQTHEEIAWEQHISTLEESPKFSNFRSKSSHKRQSMTCSRERESKKSKLVDRGLNRERNRSQIRNEFKQIRNKFNGQNERTSGSFERLESRSGQNKNQKSSPDFDDNPIPGKVIHYFGHLIKLWSFCFFFILINY